MPPAIAFLPIVLCDERSCAGIPYKVCACWVQLLTRLVFPPTVKSIHKSKVFGLFVGVEELYRHGLNLLALGLGTAPGPSSGAPSTVQFGGTVAARNWLDFIPLKKFSALVPSSPPAPLVQFTKPLTFGSPLAFRPKVAVNLARLLSNWALPSLVMKTSVPPWLVRTVPTSS